MSALTHLKAVADSAKLSDAEWGTVSVSIATLEKKIGWHFGQEVSRHFRFGSSARETILPRSMDPNSDIDYMLVFADGQFKPQTYISRIKSFVERYYSRSEVSRSYPTVRLELGHIFFELTPALEKYALQIPAPSTSYTEWMNTDPERFSAQVEQKNREERWLLKPAIRLLKYWNVRAGKLYDSFSLETFAKDRFYYGCDNIRDYFYAMIDGLPLRYGDPNYVVEGVERAKLIVAEAKRLESSGWSTEAEKSIRKLIS